MDSIIQLATPFGIVALALVVVWQVISNKKTLDNIGENHLSGLPEMKDSLMRMEQKLDKVNDNLVEIKTLLKK